MSEILRWPAQLGELSEEVDRVIGTLHHLRHRNIDVDHVCDGLRGRCGQAARGGPPRTSEVPAELWLGVIRALEGALPCRSFDLASTISSDSTV